MLIVDVFYRDKLYMTGVSVTLLRRRLEAVTEITQVRIPLQTLRCNQQQFEVYLEKLRTQNSQKVHVPKKTYIDKALDADKQTDHFTS